MPKTIDSIITDIFYVIPIIRRMILRVDLHSIDCNIKLNNLHAGIMLLIIREKLQVSEIARELQMFKPQITKHINELQEAGIIDRHRDEKDRRAVNIGLTEYGMGIARRCHNLYVTNLREKLSYLNEEELKVISDLLFKIREFGSKSELVK
jgi:DNA-binding MarR family transcriptional regulator